MNTNCVVVGRAINLEAGDLIAKEFLGGVVSGKVTAVCYLRGELTEEQLEYLKNEDVSVPPGIYEPLGGQKSILIFGLFCSTGARLGDTRETYGHMFLSHNDMVAVFPTPN